jgi:hypothetical protein
MNNLLGLAPLPAVLACAWMPAIPLAAVTTPRQDALAVIVYETRQEATRIVAHEAVGEEALTLPERLRRPGGIPEALLARTWPYGLAWRYWPMTWRVAEPPLGQVFFTGREPGDLTRLGLDAMEQRPRMVQGKLEPYRYEPGDEYNYLVQFTRNLGTVLGQPAPGQPVQPPYLGAGELHPAEYGALAADLAATLGGSVRNWERAVPQAMAGIAALNQRATSALGNWLDGYSASLDRRVACGKEPHLRVAEQLYALQAGLAQLEPGTGPCARWQFIHQHLEGAIARLKAGTPSPDPCARVLAWDGELED